VAYVYIMSSWRRTLYVGATTDLERRVNEHQNGTLSGFSAK
jgi:predicted GIY-YIG superfamily endonuclease